MNFGRVKGQVRAARILSGLLQSGRIPNALLFTGMDGIGKTLMAVEFARALFCQERKGPGEPACGFCSDCLAVDRRNHSDLALVNGQYQAFLEEKEAEKQKILHVETICHVRRDMEMPSMLGRWKIAIIEDAHRMNSSAANALLKNLEEPIPHSLWILVTSGRDQLPRTIPSRCSAVPFVPLAEPAVRAILEDQGVAPERAAVAAGLCEGSASRALELAAGEYPEALYSGPMAAFEAADSLPRESYLARGQVEAALFALSQDLRLKHLQGGLPFARVERPLRELVRLRQALRSNADPKVVLTLAGLAVESTVTPL
jgi:DNA polymerase-3 subunit delta'